MTSSKFISVLLCISIGCNQANKTENVLKTAPETAPVNIGPEIPGVPEDVIIKLLNECTYVDYIFHNLPFSLSQSEDPSINQNIAYIDYKRPLGHIPGNCKPIGRKFFHIKGEIVYDVDVYLTTHCKFYVFVDKKNKPMYANYITDDGVKFYAQTAQQARSSIGN
ncbi:MAG: hypothetical protein IPO92_14340 [Saprospiraceae bacterium]|nr:hypothetical protein [Saprospiraceae bacterium]